MLAIEIVAFVFRLLCLRELVAGSDDPSKCRIAIRHLSVPSMGSIALLYGFGDTNYGYGLVPDFGNTDSLARRSLDEATPPVVSYLCVAAIFWGQAAYSRAPRHARGIVRRWIRGASVGLHGPPEWICLLPNSHSPQPRIPCSLTAQEPNGSAVVSSINCCLALQTPDGVCGDILRVSED